MRFVPASIQCKTAHSPAAFRINPLIQQSTALTSAPRLIDFALPRLHVATRVVADSSFGNVEKSPPVQDLLRALEQGGALSFSGVPPAAHAFVTALVRKKSPERPIVIIAEGLKAQEGLQQDIETWLPKPLFFPAWEVLPHESKLPHVDVISDRLETLMKLADSALGSVGVSPAVLRVRPKTPGRASHNEPRGFNDDGAPVIVTSVVALLQKTYPPAALAERTRRIKRGDQADPMELA